jgi:adenylate kinase
MDKLDIIVLLGNVGAGKTTQAKALIEEFDIPYLGVGDLLRHEIEMKTMLGSELKQKLDKGQFASDELISSILGNRLLAINEGRCLVDGAPRTVSQAEWFDELIAAHPQWTLTAVLLSVPDEVCQMRLLLRGRTSLAQREDDRPKVIPTRLKEFHVQTEPLIRKWGDKVRVVDGNEARDVVTERVMDQLWRAGVLPELDNTWRVVV